MINKLLFILFALLFNVSITVIAQVSNEFQIANRLMQQQRYEEALPLLERATNQNPTVFVYFDKYVECQIQLKEYDKALNLVQSNISKNRNVPESNVLLGELYHLKGDTAKAFEIWNENLDRYPSLSQLYLNTATAMLERRSYKQAVDVYKKARNVFNNQLLFVSDISNAYMQDGDYENALSEWLSLIKVNPQQTNGIQRLLLRYNDPLLYDVAILEIEDIVSELAVTDDSYTTLYELQIWLLLENKLYRRAFTTAMEFESRTKNFNFSLFNVGRKFGTNNEFELAISAFEYYTENAFGEIKWRAEEEKATIYTQWVKYLSDYNIDINNKKEDLLSNAVSILNTIIDQTQTYSRIEQVYLKKAELSLDFVFDLEAAKAATKRLKSQPNQNDSKESNYLDGRIHLAENEFTQARISFTRSNRLAEVGDLAEKTRYFLALTDFYSGDFEFAKIQLKSLGRQNTSYYANDALELRLWLQEGLATDTTGLVLVDFSHAHYQLSIGKNELAKQQFLTIIDSEAPTPFKDDAFVFLSTITTEKDDYIELLTSFLIESPEISLKEKLLWIKANSIEQQYLSNNHLDSSQNSTENSTTDIGVSSKSTLDRLINSYETLILEFPQGFYAPFSRKRLAELPKQSS